MPHVNQNLPESFHLTRARWPEAMGLALLVLKYIGAGLLTLLIAVGGYQRYKHRDLRFASDFRP